MIFLPPPPNGDCVVQPFGQFVGNDPLLLNEYLPNATTPVKKIKVKIWVMQFTANDPQNFEDIPVHIDYLNLMMSKANGILGNVGESLFGGPPVTDPYPNGATHIYDSRLFLDVQEIVFIQDALGWNNDGNTCGSFNYNKYGRNDCVFDIFIIGGGRFSGCGLENFVIIPDYFTDYEEYLATGGSCCTPVDAHAWNLLHEFGHSFGLAHSWFNQFDDIVCPHCIDGTSGTCGIDCLELPGGGTCDPITDPNCNGQTTPNDDQLAPTDRQTITSNYNAAKSQFNTGLTTYLADLDMGKTSDIIDFVEGNISSISFSTSSWQMQVNTSQQLMSVLQGISPYVSAPVLAALSESTTAYTTSTFLNLAGQNPESINKGSLLYKIEADRSLTVSEFNSLQQQANTTTSRTPIEQQLREDYNTMQKNGQYLIIDQLADPNRTSDVELLTLLEDQYDQASDYALISYATDQNDPQGVATYTALLEEKIHSDWQKLQYSNYTAFNTLANTLNTQNRKWDALQASEITQLEQMAHTDAGIATARARSVLQAYYGYHFLKLPTLPSDGSKALQNEGEPITERNLEEKNSLIYAVEPSVEASPNPAKSSVQFMLQLPPQNTFATLNIFDVSGKQVHSTRILNGQQNVRWLPDSNLRAGVYYYYLETLDTRTVPKKLVLLR